MDKPSDVFNDLQPIMTKTGWIAARGRLPTEWLQRCIIWHPIKDCSVFAFFKRSDFQTSNFYEEDLRKITPNVSWWQPEPQSPSEQ